MHRLTQSAFGEYTWLSPASGALRESQEPIRIDLERSGGALALMDGRAVGCLRFDRQDGDLHVYRVAVDPANQAKGIGTALMAWIHDYARGEGYEAVRLGVRRQLPRNQHFYERLGYEVIAEHSHPGFAEVTWVEMRRPV